MNIQIAPETETSPLVNFWNDVLAPKFIRYQHIMVGGLSRHSAAIMPQLDVKRGDHVLDVGCGFGDTACDMAGLVGTEGEVLGVDCCGAFLNEAWARAERAWIGNVSFAKGDVERGVDGGPFDFVFARFGRMFFANPVSGLRAMRMAMKPGGRMAHILWRQRSDTPWLITARAPNAKG